MIHDERPVRRLPASLARANLAELLEDVGERGDRVLIERRGKTPIALISVDDFQKLQLLEAMERSKDR